MAVTLIVPLLRAGSKGSTPSVGQSVLLCGMHDMEAESYMKSAAFGAQGVLPVKRIAGSAASGSAAAWALPEGSVLLWCWTLLARLGGR